MMLTRLDISSFHYGMAREVLYAQEITILI